MKELEDKIKGMSTNVKIVTVVSLAFIAFSIYSIHLNNKANRLTIRKLRDEGYK